MNRFLIVTAFIFLTAALDAQTPATPPVPVKTTQIYNITSTTIIDCNGNPVACIDNRSAANRQNNYHSYRASGTGTWSIDMQFADVTPTGWTSYGSTGQVSNAGPSSAVGYGIDPTTVIPGNKRYHDFVRFVITGSAIIQNYTGLKDLWSLPSAGAISFPITGNQGGTAGLFYPDVFAGLLPSGCTAAHSSGETLFVTQPWTAQLSETLNCNMQVLTGGIIQPAAPVGPTQQVVTIEGSFQAGRYQVFDISLGGAGSISFASTAIDRGYPEWFGSSVVANTCAADTLSTGWAGMQAALPVAGPGPGSSVINQGEVDLANTGAGNKSYCIGSSLQLIPRVYMHGAPVSTTQITATPGFASASQTFMMTTLNAAGGSNPCNDNFNMGLDNITFNGLTNSGNQYAAGLEWCPSIGSHLGPVTYIGSNLGFSIGGPPATSGSAASSDNNTIDGLTCNLTAIVSFPFPQCLAIQEGGTDVSAPILTNTKTIQTNDTLISAGQMNPQYDTGYGNTSVKIHGINCENCQWAASIDDVSVGIEITGIQHSLHRPTGSCPTLALAPRTVLISASAQTWHVEGYNICTQWGVVFGSGWKPSMGVNMGYTIVDPFNCIQQVTTAGTLGTTQPTWGGSALGSCTATTTTSDGTAVFTNEGSIGACTIYVVTNCGATPGATNTSDLGVYGFECWPDHCISFNKDIPAINQITYYQPINVSTVLGNHFTSVSGTPSISIAGSGCMLGSTFVRDGGGAFDVGSGSCTTTVTFSAQAGYHHAVFGLSGTAGPSMGAQDNTHIDITTTQAGIVYYTVLDTE